MVDRANGIVIAVIDVLVLMNRSLIWAASLYARLASFNRRPEATDGTVADKGSCLLRNANTPENSTIQANRFRLSTSVAVNRY
jgi:hypothetical protein